MSTASGAPSAPSTNLFDPPPSTEPGDAGELVGAPLKFGLKSRALVPVIAVLAGIASVLSGQEPTGTAWIDALWAFGFGFVVVWIGHRASAVTIVVSAVLALFFAALQVPALFLGIGAVAVAILLTAGRRLDRDSWNIGAAVCAALVSQAVLYLPSIGFVGSASLLAAIAVAPILVSGYRTLEKPPRRRTRWALMVLVLFAAIATGLVAIVALSARDGLETAVEQAEDGVDALQAVDQPTALTLLQASEENFAQAADQLGGPLTWPARLVPILAQHRRALETAANQGAALAGTAARTANQADVERIRGQNGRIDVELIESVNVELTVANRTLAAAQQSLEDVNSLWLVPQLSSRLDDVATELQETGADIDLANHATSVLPQVLGSQGQRRYMVLFVQPAESREFGGFVGAYGLLEADQGQFRLVESGGIDVDFGSGVAQFTDPGEFPVSYVNVGPQINPQNLTAVSDLGTIAAAIQDLAPQWRQDTDFDIDGVITLDPYALANMLELTGPLSITGRTEPLTSDNVVDFLLRDQYINFEDNRDERQDALRALAGQAFARLFSIEIPGPEQLGSIFGPSARANRLSITTFDETENAFFDRVFLSANFPSVGSAVDMVGIYGQTGVASKLDGYATRSSTYDVTFDPATGQTQSQLVITERNDAPSAAGGFVLGRGDQDGVDGTPLIAGTNFLALGLYTRADVQTINATTPFDGTLEPLPALSYERHTVLVEVPQGGESQITIDMTADYEPNRYDVFIPAQATANIGDFTLTVRPVAGWRFVGLEGADDGSWTTTFDSDEARAFSFTFEPNN